MDGINQLFADRPSNEGKSLLDTRDTRGAYVIRDMNDIIREQGRRLLLVHLDEAGDERAGVS